MNVYEDMANDAGYLYGTYGNELLASLLMEKERDEYMEQLRLEILFRKFD